MSVLAGPQSELRITVAVAHGIHHHGHHRRAEHRCE
jgi:hypothetical protein